MLKKSKGYWNDFNRSSFICLILSAVIFIFIVNCGSDGSSNGSENGNTNTSSDSDGSSDRDNSTTDTQEDSDDNNRSQVFEVPWRDITIDGNMDDWQGVAAFIEDDAGDVLPEYNYLDMARVWVAHNQEFICFAVELVNPLDLSEIIGFDAIVEIQAEGSDTLFELLTDFYNGPGAAYVTIYNGLDAITVYPSSYCHYGANLIEWRARKQDFDLDWSDSILLRFILTDEATLFTTDVTDNNPAVFLDEAQLSVDADPDTLTLGIGETIEVNISGGQAPYTVDAVSNLAVAAHLTDNTLSVTGYLSGTVQLTVSDTSGDSVDISASVNPPSSMEGDKCIEVSPNGQAGAGWQVFVRNSNTNEALAGFSLVAVSGCIDDPYGNQVLCYRNAVIQQDQLVSFDVIWQEDMFIYPADVCF